MLSYLLSCPEAEEMNKLMCALTPSGEIVLQFIVDGKVVCDPTMDPDNAIDFANKILRLAAWAKQVGHGPGPNQIQ